MNITMDHISPIDTETRLVGLLGRPLGHSLSPAMHNRAFKSLNLNFLYLPIEVADEDLHTVAVGIARMNFAGYNVTIPHKIRIMDSLDSIDPLARAIGAVNTVRIHEGRTSGYNTDGIGFIRSLEEAGDLSINDKSVLMLGCGGAARAIAMTLADQGAARIALSNRTEDKAHTLSEDVNRQGRRCSDAVPMKTASLEATLREVDILINTTSVGMHPHENHSPIEAKLVKDHLVVCDIVYNPRQTKLLHAARQNGCRIVEGLGMLVYQGAAAFRLWTGRDAPIEDMFEAIRC